MALQRIFFLLLIAVLLAVGWRSVKSSWVQGWLRPSVQAPAVPIQFDNGSVRQERAASAAAAPVAAAPPRVPGTLRKCKRGETVIYTDAACPSGTKEQAVSGGTLTVLDGPPKPAPAARHGNVRDLLGPPGEPTLAEKHMERMLER
jgi:hypothetical protein